VKQALIPVSGLVKCDIEVGLGNGGILESNDNWIMMCGDCRVLEVPHNGVHQHSG
jgi:hypothetical protein